MIIYLVSFKLDTSMKPWTGEILHVIIFYITLGNFEKHAEIVAMDLKVCLSFRW